jgi:hypothetical protein
MDRGAGAVPFGALGEAPDWRFSSGRAPTCPSPSSKVGRSAPTDEDPAPQAPVSPRAGESWAGAFTPSPRCRVRGAWREMSPFGGDRQVMTELFVAAAFPMPFLVPIPSTSGAVMTPFRQCLAFHFARSRRRREVRRLAVLQNGLRARWAHRGQRRRKIPPLPCGPHLLKEMVWAPG